MSTVAPYRSTKSVPDRVDRAWGQGFDAGHRDLLRAFGLVAVVESVRFMRGGGFPRLLTFLVGLLLALLIIPSCLLVWTVRRLRSAWVIVPADRVSVLLDDGSVF